MYTKEQLNDLIKSVEIEFSAHLAKVEDSSKLAKSEDAPEKKEESKEEAKPEDKKPEFGKPEDKKEEHKEESKEEPKAEAAEDKGQQPQSEEKPAEHNDEEAHNYDDEDMAHLNQMYGSMSRGELRAHHDVIRQAMDGHGLAKCEDAMAKSEKDVVIETAPAEDVSLLKSELEAKKAESEDLKKNLVAVENFLKKYIERSAPVGKAITSLDIIAKTENTENVKPLSKSEIDKKLLDKANDQSLSKSDREAINNYYFTKNVEKISHLLK